MTRGKLESRTRLTYHVAFEVDGGRANAKEIGETLRTAVQECYQKNHLQGEAASVRVQLQKRVVTQERSS